MRTSTSLVNLLAVSYTTMSTCIYCKKSEPNVTFDSREHVIPQGFGAFGAETFVLHNKVCDDCNSYFGDHLDIVLARGSMEGFKRAKYLAKVPLKQPPGGIHSRLKVTLPKVCDDKRLSGGLLVDVLTYGNTGVVNLLPQISFRDKETGERVVVPKAELQSPKYVIESKYLENSEIGVFASSQEELDQLMKLLESKGISSEILKEIPFGDMQKPNTIEMHAKVDEIIYRAVSKVAFNYITYLHDGKNLNILEPAFDSFRKYIRYGNASWDIQLEKWFLGQESEYLQAVTEGILVATEVRTGGLFVKVRIFDFITYLIPVITSIGQSFKEEGYFFKPGASPVKLYGFNRKESPIIPVIIDYRPDIGIYWRAIMPPKR